MFENKNVIPLEFLLRQKKKKILRLSIKKKKGRRLLGSTSSWEQRVFLTRSRGALFVHSHRLRPHEHFSDHSMAWEECRDAPPHSQPNHHENHPAKNVTCARFVVCTWVGVHQHWGQVFNYITHGLRGSSYPVAHGVHLHQNLYSPKPPLVYMHTEMYTFLSMSPSAEKQWRHCWAFQASLGAGNGQDASTLLIRRRIMALTPPVPCRRFCWPQGKLTDKSGDCSFLLTMSKQEQVQEKLFKICSTFTVFVFLLTFFWTLA